MGIDLHKRCRIEGYNMFRADREICKRGGLLMTSWLYRSIKKVSISDPANYRPVYLTSVPCKIMESLIKDPLLKHLENHRAISQSQYGFASGRSCLTNLLMTLECWTKALDDGYGIDVLYLDYRKTFNSVHHLRLLEKLKTVCILLQNGVDFYLKTTLNIQHTQNRHFLNKNKLHHRCRQHSTCCLFTICSIIECL